MTTDAMPNNFWESSSYFLEVNQKINRDEDLQNLGPPQHSQREQWEAYSGYTGIGQTPAFPMAPVLPGELPENNSGASGESRHSRNKGLLSPPANWDPTATTVMIRNLPNKYTQQMLLLTLQESGFRACAHFDFFYLPMDRGNGANLGYGFVNFVDPATAGAFASTFQGRRMRRFNSRKTIDVMPALIQGYEANHQHYSGTRVAHAEDHQCRPLFLREMEAAGVVTSTLAVDPETASSPDNSPSRRRRRGGANGRRGGRAGRVGSGGREESPEPQADDTDVCIKRDFPEDTTRGRPPAKMELSWSFISTSADATSVSGGSDRGKRDLSDDYGDADQLGQQVHFGRLQTPDYGVGFATPERQISAPEETISHAGSFSPAGPLSPAQGLPMAWGLFPMEPTSPSARQAGEMSPNASCYACHSCGTLLQPNFLFCPFCSATAATAPTTAQLLYAHPR